MSENTRKAVVTTAQVRDAFASYASALVKVGQESVVDHEFDKGLRGRGFAEYDGNGNIVQSFETKDDALNYYSLIAKGMWIVLDAQESAKPAKTPAKVAEKPAA